MKKIMSLLILISLLVLPVLAGSTDAVSAFLPVSAARAETEIGETVSVEDARNIRLTNIFIYDNYWDECDELYTGYYLCGDIYAPGAEGIRIWVDGELINQGDYNTSDLYESFSENGEHVVSASGKYNGQWSDPREVWRGEVKTKGDQQATTFTVEMPESAEDNVRVVFDWKESELEDTRLYLTCVDGEKESLLWNDWEDEDGLYAGRDDILIPGECLSVPGEYVLKLCCKKAEYNLYTYTKHITVPGTAPGLVSVVINNNEPVVFSADSSKTKTCEIPMRLSKTDAVKFEWYDPYYGDRTDAEETAAVDGVADIAFSTECSGGDNTRKVAARAWIGDEEGGVWTNWTYAEFNVQVNVTEGGAALPPVYTISGGENGSVIISVTGITSGDTIDGNVRGEDGLIRRSVYETVKTGNTLNITLTTDQLDMSGTYYVSLRTISRGKPYSAYTVRKFVYGSENNIPGPVISLLPEPADGQYNINTEYRLQFEREDAVSFEYKWNTDSYKDTVNVQNGILLWGEEQDIVYRERPAEITLICRAKLADGSWTDWTEKAFTFVSKGALPQPGVSLGGETQPAAGYDLDIILTGCDTEPVNVKFYYVQLVKTNIGEDIAWRRITPGEFTDANTFTWHILGSMLHQGSYRVEVEAYAQNGYSDAEKKKLEFVIPEPAEPMAEKPALTVDPDDNRYYPGEVTLTAYAEGAVQYRFRVKDYTGETLYDVVPDDKGAGVLVPDLQAYYSYEYYVSYRKSADGPWSAETCKMIYVSSPSERLPSQNLRIEAENCDAMPAGTDLVFTFTPVNDTDYYADCLSHYFLSICRTVQDGEDDQVKNLTIRPDRLEEDGITINEDGDYQYTCPAQYLLDPGEYYAWIRALDYWDCYTSAKSYVRFTLTDEGLPDAPVISVSPGDHYINEDIAVNFSMASAVSVDQYYLTYDNCSQYVGPDSTVYLHFYTPGTYPINVAAKLTDGSWTKSATVPISIVALGTAEPIGLTIPGEHFQWKELTAVLAGPIPNGGDLHIDLEYYDEDDGDWDWRRSNYVLSVSGDNTAWLFAGEEFDKPGLYRLVVITEVPGYYDSEEQTYEFTVIEKEQPDAPEITMGSETVWFDEPFAFTLYAEGAEIFNYRLHYDDSWYDDSDVDADENGTAQIEASVSPYDEMKSFDLEARARIGGIWSKWGTVHIEPQAFILDPVGITGIQDIQIGESLTLEVTLPENATGFRWWLIRAGENGENDLCIDTDSENHDAGIMQLTLDEGRFIEAGTYYLTTKAYGKYGEHYAGTHAEHSRFTVTGERLPGPAISVAGLAAGQEKILVNQKIAFIAYLEGATDYRCRMLSGTYSFPMELTEDGRGKYETSIDYDAVSGEIECCAKVNGLWTRWSVFNFDVAEGIQLPDPDFSGLKTVWAIGDDLVIPVTEQGVRQLVVDVYRCNEDGSRVENLGRFESVEGTLTVPENKFEDEGYYSISGKYYGTEGYLNSEAWSDDILLHFTGVRYPGPVITLPADGVWLADNNVFTFTPPAGEYTADSYEIRLLNSAGEPYASADGLDGSWTWYPNYGGSFTLKVRAKIGGKWSDWSKKSFEVNDLGEAPITFSGKPTIRLFPGQVISLTFTDSVEGQQYMVSVYPEGNTTGPSLVSDGRFEDGSVSLDTSDLTAGTYYAQITSNAPRYLEGSDGFTFTMDSSSLPGPEMTIEAKEKYVLWEPFTVTLQHEEDVSEYWLEARWYDEEAQSGGSCSGSAAETPGVYTLTLTTKGTWTIRARVKIGEYWSQWTEKTITVTSLGVAQYPGLSYDRTVLRGENIAVTIAPVTGTDSVTLTLMSGQTSIATYVVDCRQENTATFGREHFELTEGEYVLRVSPGPATGYEPNPVAHKDYPVTMNCFTLTGHEYQAAACTADGNIEYWYCTTCGKYYADEDATQEITAESTVIPATGHINPLEHTEAKAATCTEAGNIEYWHCTRCDGYFTDAGAETEIAPADIVIPALGHILTAHPAVPATCTTAGNSAYWECTREDCGRYFSDENGETEIEKDSWVIPALGHILVAHPAVSATCTEAGNSAYWECNREGCGKYFSDKYGTREIAEDSWIIPELGHAMIEHPAADATCTTAGNSAYWYCSRCEKYFSDAEGTTEIAENSWVVGQPLGHQLKRHAAVAATCLAAGNSEYWECTREGCGRYFSDENGENEIAENSWIIPKVPHTMTAHPAVEATCTTAGNSAYWYCSTCEKYYDDAQGTAEIDEGSWIINALGHHMTHHPAVAEATCTEAEGSEYWSCDRCHKYFADEAGNTEIAENSWVTGDAALGHDWDEPEYEWSDDHKKCTATRTCKRDRSHIEKENGEVTSKTTPATKDKTGKTVYTAAFTNPAFAAQTKEVTIPKLKAPVGTYTDKATGTYEIRADWTAAFKKPAKSKATVTIPDTVKVKGYDIPVTEIADKAFSKDKNLTTITIGSKVRTIGKNAFSGCAKLKTVKGGGAAETIKDSAFSGCAKLSKIPAFPKLKTIGANAFKDCKALTKVTIGASVNAIGKAAFSGCAKLKTITIKSTLLTKKNVKSGAFKGIAAKATIKCPKAKLKDYQKFLPGKGVPKTAKIK